MPNKVLVREVWATMKARPAYSIVFFAVAFLAMFAVTLQFAHAQNRNGEIAALLESPEYRTVRIVATDEASILEPRLLMAPQSLNTLISTWGLSAAFDVENPAVPAFGRASAAYYYEGFGELPINVIHGRLPERAGEAIVPWATYERLGYDASGGTIATPEGREWAVVGAYIPQHERAPASALIYADSTARPMRTCALLVRSTRDIDSTAAAIVSLAGLGRDDGYSIDKARDIEQLGGRLTASQSSYTVAAIMGTVALSLLILAFLAVLMVNSRRTEFGRRRALGAPRRDIVALLVAQSVLIVAAACCAAGIGGLIVAALFFPRGIPSAAFLGAVATLLILGTLAVQLPSALVAAYRDPVRVLRTP